MEHIGRKFLFVMTILTVSIYPLMAQGSGSEGWFGYGLIFVAVIVILGAVVVVSESLLKVEAKRAGVDLQKDNSGLFGGFNNPFRSKFPKYLRGEKLHLLKKGHDIKLEGGAKASKPELIHTTRYALQPTNYRGIRPIPKLEVEEGQDVLAGQPIFFDKEHPEIKYVSPVSGEFVELNRGAKRAITELVILADKDEVKYQEIPSFDLAKGDRAALKKHLMAYGAWPLLNERPFDRVPDPEQDPKSIFVTTFDSSPLAPDFGVIVEGKEAEFQKGLDVLNHLTDGSVYLGLDARGKERPHAAFAEAKNVEKHWFRGPHPSGNVGVHIHHVDPIRTGQSIWTVDVQNVITIGGMFLHHKFIADRTIALVGNGLKEPKYIKTIAGANVGELLTSNLQDGGNRIINGNVLVGDVKNENQYIDFNTRQITVIPEGDYYEAFGWLIPGALRPTVSRSYPSFLFPDLEFKADTNSHGERRAFVVTGQYEKLLPMDIYLQHLLKSIMINDFERMEGLGILELSEEDVALAEFACTSKIPLQQILREGLDYVQTQM
jgi:Na+-transporting NADH:ubiquinone oxidoreductase subunit A